jgi:hypothetical protein
VGSESAKIYGYLAQHKRQSGKSDVRSSLVIDSAAALRQELLDHFDQNNVILDDFLTTINWQLVATLTRFYPLYFTYDSETMLLSASGAIGGL